MRQALQLRHHSGATGTISELNYQGQIIFPFLARLEFSQYCGFANDNWTS
jgi:hypothetical protein